MVESLSENWAKLPEPLQKSLKALCPSLSKVSKVVRDAMVYERQFRRSKCDCEKCNAVMPIAKTVATCISILINIPVLRLLKEPYIKDCYAYSLDGDMIEIKDCFYERTTMRVLKGKYNNNNVIVKYCDTGKRDITFELSVYNRLQYEGVPLPWYTDEFFILGKNVLVMEELYEIGKGDDEYKVAYDIITALKVIKDFGCHSDIKHGNIMKNAEGKYFLIDFGGFASEKLKHGYKRWTWTPKWSSQPPHTKEQVITPKNDLIELCYTLRYLQLLRARREPTESNVKTGFSGTLSVLYNKITKLNSRAITDKDYDELLEIVQSKRIEK